MENEKHTSFRFYSISKCAQNSVKFYLQLNLYKSVLNEKQFQKKNSESQKNVTIPLNFVHIFLFYRFKMLILMIVLLPFTMLFYSTEF